MKTSVALIAVVMLVIGLLGAAVFSVNHPNACKPDHNASDIPESKQPEEVLWCPTTWSAVTFLTFALVIVGGVQTVVFGVQAAKLAETIETMRVISRDQSNDVRDSIAQATRAATAMEGMSAAMLTSTGITTEIGRTQREFGQMQMRAYLTVIYGLTVPQDDTTGHFAEIRFQLINNGHTPAYEVSYKADAGVLPFPLPDDFSLPIRDFPISSKSVVGPGQNLVISCIIRDRLSPEQIEQCLQGNSLRLYMWGIATYRDAFNTARQTTFSQSVVWMRNGHSMGVNTRRHNEAT